MSLIKSIFGLVILLVDALAISVKEDTAVALVLGLVGVFLFFRGISYFVFYWTQWLFCAKVQKERMRKDAYKCSFLF